MTYRFELREHTPDGQVVELPAEDRWHPAFVPAWRAAVAQARERVRHADVRICVRLFDSTERMYALTYVYPRGR